jgi:N-methylhydantoinase A
VEPTVTDAAAVLGYLDAESFLGGRVRLNIPAAHDAVGKLGEQIGLDPARTAAAILTVAGERMADAIREITINQGVDPREAVIVAGGGAAGMTIVPIVEAIGCSRVLIPPTAGALSAAGAHFSDVLREFTRSYPTTSAAFDHDGVVAAKRALDDEARAFGERLHGTGVTGFEWDYIVESRYAEQIWDLEVPFDDEMLTRMPPACRRATIADRRSRSATASQPWSEVSCAGASGTRVACAGRAASTSSR